MAKEVLIRKIGKRKLKTPLSHKLYDFYNEFPLYDRALPRICKKIKKVDGYLAVIDVGANIGDTVSLITDQVSGSFLCIEGDTEYLPFLRDNLIGLKNIVIEESYCSDSDNEKENFSIVREIGTAKLVKGGEKESNLSIKKLDTIISENPGFEKANLIKIDTDGFEINVLKGAGKFIEKALPLIFFEFVPELYLDNKQDPLFIFDFLAKKGYEEILLYDNFGNPKEIVNTSDKLRIEELINLIDNKEIYYYDILAWHKSKKNKYKKIVREEKEVSS